MTEYFDHFDGSLPSWLSTDTDSPGSATVTGSELSLASGGANGAAMAYFNTALDPTKNFMCAIMFRHSGTSADSLPMYVVDSSGAPAVDTNANFEPNTRIRIESQQNRILHKYFQTSHNDQYWRNSDNTWQTNFAISHDPYQEDDYYIVVLEWDGDGSRFKIASYGIETNGMELEAVTTWVNESSLETISNDMYLCFGWPYTDQSDNGTIGIEWMLL
jgi:hypothetical protein